MRNMKILKYKNLVSLSNKLELKDRVKVYFIYFLETVKLMCQKTNKSIEEMKSSLTGKKLEMY